MRFYVLHAVVRDQHTDAPEPTQPDELEARTLEFISEQYTADHPDAFVFVSAQDKADMVFGILSESRTAEEVFAEFRGYLPLEAVLSDVAEAVFHTIDIMLRAAEQMHSVREADEILRRFRLDALAERRKFCGDALVRTGVKRERLEERGRQLAIDGSFLPELDRIYAGRRLKREVQGHPVQYRVITDNRNTRRAACRLLLSALYENGRLNNQRYAFVDFTSDGNPPDERFEALYRSCRGGAVLVRYEVREGGEHARAVTEGICRLARQYRQSVLTVFCLPSAPTVVAQFDTLLTDWRLVDITENRLNYAQAMAYLRDKAADSRLSADKRLTVRDGVLYSAEQLDEVFERWKGDKLCDTVYPQYKDVCKCKAPPVQPQGDAAAELDRLIGLDRAKAVIRRIIGLHTAAKRFADRGYVAKRGAKHMVFTGNPGTAKTTVARLFARILYENGVTRQGVLHEVGRAELVGRYVGHTAPLVKQAFDKASGGVLFIDEAYALTDDRDGSFGDEAIHAIVQEMENRRDDVIVIFAGYPDKMETFLQKNPGMRSRIAFHVAFDDYSTDELLDIASQTAQADGLSFSGRATEKLRQLFDEARCRHDFGNGRYARTVVEHAQMAQANRLLTLLPEQVTDRELATLQAEDIEAVSVGECGREKRNIGFV